MSVWKMRTVIGAAGLALVVAADAPAEVLRATVASRVTVAGGHRFGAAGAYEKLAGTLEFAIDPANPRNAVIAALEHAPRDAGGRVRFTSDFYVLRPVDPALGNGVLLFDIANRGRKVALGVFNHAPAHNDPAALADFGDGFLMREGYTVVWVGWQFDVAPPLMRTEAPAVTGARPGMVRFTFIPDARDSELSPAEMPVYPPAGTTTAADSLTVRDRFWDAPSAIPRERWRLVLGAERPRIALDGGFEPGRIYELTYLATGGRVAGVGLAAIRDAASAFVRREDMPVRGRSAYAFGLSQSGRFLRQFLLDGFNLDERGDKVFDAVWPHVAGAALGSFNDPFAMPGYASFPATRFPFTDAVQEDARGRSGGILSRYGAYAQPRVFYTNSSVEYWGQGRAAALTHTTADGTRDAHVPDAVRIYLIAGSQHGPAAFPPSRGAGRHPANPVPHAGVMRALLRALHRWTTAGDRPPDSRHPRLDDRTLVRPEDVRLPHIPGVSHPRTITGPAEVLDAQVVPLPFLVPQVDDDGNEVAGIRVPEVAVALGTATGWNFRPENAGNPGAIVPLLGSYLPFARTRAGREAAGDPRPSIEERYRGRADYLARVEEVVRDLVRARYLLEEDTERILERAAAQWDHAVAR